MIEKSNLPEKEKLIFIQKSLKGGLSREEIASILGYKNWKSLDIYMRRQGMKWDSKRNTYYYTSESSDGPYEITDLSNPKVSMIISKFNQKNAEPRDIARETGFKDHREMASYMAARGYTWSNEVKNYVKNPSENKYIEKETLQSIPDDIEIDTSQNSSRSLEKYIPLFEILLKHKERLLNLLIPTSSPGTIPRYTVPGVTRTKSFYMSDSVSNLISEFSKRNNISQKEVIEAAVIEFLKKYSFEKEVNEMLGRI